MTAPAPTHRSWIRTILDHYRHSMSGLSREVWVLSIVLFVNRCGTMVLPFLALYLTDQWGFSEFQAGLLLATYGVGSFGGVYLGGWLVDRIGYRAVQIASMALAGAGFVVFGYLEPGVELYVGAFGLGMLAESFRPANASALAAFATPAERPRAYALNRLALNLGWTIAPAVAGFLAEVDYGWLFWIDGVTCVAASVALAMLLPRSSQEREVEEAVPEGAPRSPWRDRFYLATLVLLLLQGVVFMQIMGTYPLYLRDVLAYPERLIGIVMLLNGAIIVLAEMPFITAIQGKDPLRMIALGVLCIGFGFGLLPLHGSLAFVIALMVLWTIGEMLVSPLLSSWVANRADKRSRGAYMAAMGMTFSTCSIVAPLGGTWIYQYLGPDVLWYGSLVLLGLVFVAYQGLAAREAASVS